MWSRRPAVYQTHRAAQDRNKNKGVKPLQFPESSSFGYQGKDQTVADAAAAFVSSVIGRDFSRLPVEERVACIPEATNALLEAARGEQPGIAHAEHGPILSPRQWEILRMLAFGKRPKEISEELGRAEITIRNHIRIIRGAFGVQTYQEAVSKARRLGYVE